MHNPRLIRDTGYLLITVAIILSVGCAAYYWNYTVFQRIDVSVQIIITVVSIMLAVHGIILIRSANKELTRDRH